MQKISEEVCLRCHRRRDVCWGVRKSPAPTPRVSLCSGTTSAERDLGPTPALLLGGKRSTVQSDLSPGRAPCAAPCTGREAVSRHLHEVVARSGGVAWASRGAGGPPSAPRVEVGARPAPWLLLLGCCFSRKQTLRWGLRCTTFVRRGLLGSSAAEGRTDEPGWTEAEAKNGAAVIAPRAPGPKWPIGFAANETERLVLYTPDSARHGM